jgi:hypothetical protein
MTDELETGTEGNIHGLPTSYLIISLKRLQTAVRIALIMIEILTNQPQNTALEHDVWTGLL